jgi:hypothetical protein
MGALHTSSSHVEKEGGTNPFNPKSRIYMWIVDCPQVFATRGMPTREVDGANLPTTHVRYGGTRETKINQDGAACQDEHGCFDKTNA